MHSFLRSMGYSAIRQNSQLEQLINETVAEPQISTMYKRPDGTSLVEYTRKDLSFGGFRVYGEEDEKGQFRIGTYAPVGFTFENVENIESDIYVNKRVDSDSYTGMCDDPRIGISLIFYITNPVEYFEHFGGEKVIHDKSVQFFALAQAGKIILPTLMRVKDQEKLKQDNNRKNQLLAEAKKGNPEAIESLTISDIDNYAMVSQRIKNEDVLSIVDTSLSPFGSESDMYNITGIIDVAMKEQNRLTGETVWHLMISCNEIPIDVFVNDKDLLGEPAVGRRFRGSVWLQGRLVVKD